MIKQTLCAATMFATLSTGVEAAAASTRDAAFASSGESVRAQPFLFTGATLRMNLEGRSQSKPEVALRFAGGRRSEASELKIGEGLALAASSKGKAKLSIAGQNSKIIGDRLGMSDAAKIALIGGAVVVVGLIVLVASSGIGDAASAGFEED